MDLPRTEAGNKHVVVFQDFLLKWPLVFPVPDQNGIWLVRLLVNEVIPMFGVPEALLSDRGANLLSHVIKDVCELLGIHKLNTTAYHPQCNGMVERFNRNLKAILRKHAARFKAQWDRYLPGVLWAYRNTPHEATGEKPSFLLLGHDCRTPTEACYLPDTSKQVGSVEEYREELMLSLTSARDLAAQSIQKAQEQYKHNYDCHTTCTKTSLRVGDWVLVHIPQDESGPQRKLSQPWHGPYRVVSICDPDVLLTNGLFSTRSHNPGSQVACKEVSFQVPWWVLLVWRQTSGAWTTTTLGCRDAGLLPQPCDSRSPSGAAQPEQPRQLSSGLSR